MEHSECALYRGLDLIAKQFYLPGSYAYESRYRQHLAFVLVYDWIPALVIFGRFSEATASIHRLLIAYLAFISLYEVGYLANDFISTRSEEAPRIRTSLVLSHGQLLHLIALRATWFGLLAWLGGFLHTPEWWTFHCLVTTVFALHNLPLAKRFKVFTFYFLAVSRSVSAYIFLLPAEHVAPSLLAATVLYANFRLLAYLESKNMLMMPGRKEPSTTLFYYGITLCIALCGQTMNTPFGTLAIYFFCAALAYQIASTLRSLLPS